jgi:antitoxin component YwqK of YwqJK toxin-antitoxin module
MKYNVLCAFIVIFCFIACNKTKQENEYAKRVIEWYDSIENIPKREFYLNKKQKNKGFYKSYHKNGTTKSIFPLVNKERHGVCKIFYPNGNISIKVECKNDIEDGIYRSYDKDGELSIKGQYEGGKEIGKWYYYEGDTLKKIELYEQGEVVHVDTVSKIISQK